MHPRTATHIANARSQFGSGLILTDQELVALIGRVGDPAKAMAKISACIQLPGPPPAIVHISTDAELVRPVTAPPVAVESLLVEDFQMVQIFVDETNVGCGFRRFMVLEIGPRVVRLFSCASLENILVDRKRFERDAKPAKRAFKKELASIVRRNIAMADRANERVSKEIMTDGGVWAQHALSILED